MAMDQRLRDWVDAFLSALEEIARLTRACGEAVAQLDMAALAEMQRRRAEAIERLEALGQSPGPLPADVRETVRAAARDVLATDARVMAEMEATLEAVGKLLEGVSQGQAIRGYSPDEEPEPRFFDRKT